MRYLRQELSRLFFKPQSNAIIGSMDDIDGMTFEAKLRYRARLKNEKSSGRFEFPDGSIEYYSNGQRHREDGPAVILTDGSQYWYRNDKPHRDHGPAFEDSDGDRAWYRDGKLHREDGPALVSGSRQQWYIDGQPVNLV